MAGSFVLLILLSLESVGTAGSIRDGPFASSGRAPRSWPDGATAVVISLFSTNLGQLPFALTL